jgi:hypothetical protein
MVVEELDVSRERELPLLLLKEPMLEKRKKRKIKLKKSRNLSLFLKIF